MLRYNGTIILYRKDGEMETYRGAVIFKSHIERQWYAVFGYGDHVKAASRKAVLAAVDNREQ